MVLDLNVRVQDNFKFKIYSMEYQSVILFYKIKVVKSYQKHILDASQWWHQHSKEFVSNNFCFWEAQRAKKLTL